jgi:hypothetical protein
MSHKLKTLLLHFIVLVSFSCAAQDTLCKCRKTTSFYAEGLSIIYINREDGKHLEMIRFNSLGDTAQWWKYQYNAKGFEIRHYSTLPSNLFEYKHILDSKGRITASISTVGNRIDTIEMNVVEYNEFDDPESHFLYGGSYVYVYDSLDQMIEETLFNDEGDTIDWTIYKYDLSGNQMAWTYSKNDGLDISAEYTFDNQGNQITEDRFLNDSLIFSEKLIYNDSGKFVEGVKKNAHGEIIYTGHVEYDEEGFFLKSFGTDYIENKMQNWETLFEKVKCPEW